MILNLACTNRPLSLRLRLLLAYHFAKEVIKLINTLSDIVEADPELSKFIKVVFIPNYRVTVAEILMNATDVSNRFQRLVKKHQVPVT